MGSAVCVWGGAPAGSRDGALGGGKGSGAPSGGDILYILSNSESVVRKIGKQKTAKFTKCTDM